MDLKAFGIEEGVRYGSNIVVAVNTVQFGVVDPTVRKKAFNARI